ncbi:MAG: aspartyl protease family protein [Candidatus Bipolaricaulis sp.]|nr:aspartyl protease family protein [Candidatus Thermoplasmatota archaeon]MDD5452700.1 aspartyl protease family protein [Candidatus Bipolaricaulis sp.]
MGETRARLRIYGEDGKVSEVEALVDTGSTFTKIPQHLASALGLQVKYGTEVELADGRLVKRGLALVEVELEGVRRPMLIAIGGEEERPLIGYTTLEVLGLKVNPITGKLERTVAIEYGYIARAVAREIAGRLAWQCPGTLREAGSRKVDIRTRGEGRHA